MSAALRRRRRSPRLVRFRVTTRGSDTDPPKGRPTAPLHFRAGEDPGSTAQRWELDYGVAGGQVSVVLVKARLELAWYSGQSPCLRGEPMSGDEAPGRAVSAQQSSVAGTNQDFMILHHRRIMKSQFD